MQLGGPVLISFLALAAPVAAIALVVLFMLVALRVVRRFFRGANHRGPGVGLALSSTRFTRFAEPSRRGPRGFLKIWRRLSRPGDEAVGAHEHSAQA
jgi:hypothetical protein